MNNPPGVPKRLRVYRYQLYVTASEVIQRTNLDQKLDWKYGWDDPFDWADSPLYLVHKKRFRARRIGELETEEMELTEIGRN